MGFSELFEGHRKIIKKKTKQKVVAKNMLIYCVLARVILSPSDLPTRYIDYLLA